MTQRKKQVVAAGEWATIVGVLLVLILAVATAKGSDAGASVDGFAAPAEAKGRVCFGRVVNYLGTPGPDVILGRPGTDVVAARKGNDSIFGLDGNDYVCAGRGSDTLEGGAGFDKANGGGGYDRCRGAERVRRCEEF